MNAIDLSITGLFVALFLGISTDLTAQFWKKNSTDSENQVRVWKYDIECVGTGLNGTYLLKIWSYSESPAIDAEKAKRNAVHGVVFKGVSGARQGCTAQPALSRNPNLEMEQKTFFDQFFADGGKYAKYTNLTSQGPPKGEVIKLGKKEYKVGLIVSVQKDALRQDLESAGILKSLSSGF